MLKNIKKYIRHFKSWLAYNPPAALSGTGWRLFNEEFAKNAPVRFFISKNFKKTFIWPVKHKYENICNWIRYRTYNRYHIVKTGLSPGYHCNDTIILNANFSILKTFVERELASFSYWCSDDIRDKDQWKKYIPFYYNFFPVNNIEFSIKHLEWAATLDDPTLPVQERCAEQAHSAREILALYNWWVNIRPVRKEYECGTYSDQGLGALSILDDDFDREAADYKQYKITRDQIVDQEAAWEDEDNKMLERLIKIRKHLWT